MRRPLEPGEHPRTIRVGELERRYILHVPAGYDGSRPLPAVVVFHGAGGAARVAIVATGWSNKADGVGFFAVYPEGVRPDPNRSPTFLRNPQFWNTGAGIGYADEHDIDDIGFARALLDEVPKLVNVDSRRVYASGFSSGASLAFQAAMEFPERIAAIGPVAGHLWAREPRPTRPIPLVYVAGTADPLNPYHGGVVTSPWGHVRERPPLERSVLTWVSWIGCSSEPQVVLDRDGVRCLRYGPGPQGAEVDFYTVEGAGHVWPGGPPVLAEWIAGKPSDRLNATDVIWEFFERHPLP
jgi:polyhydroxybutyrate depolymerase